MAHMIDVSTGRAAIAFVGEKPWHGLGQELQPGADLTVWQKAAGLDFELLSKPALYIDEGVINEVPERKVLLRSDTRAPLATVSDRYNIVQPGEVLEFYRDLVASAGFTLETAGALAGGRRYWALAKTGLDASINGADPINGYLLLGTSCDGSLATTAMFTSIRVVCQNTLGFAVREGESGAARKYLKVPHSRTFDPQAIKVELGLAEQSWQSFIAEASRMATVKVSNKEAIEFLVKVLGDDTKPIEEQEEAKTIKKVYDLFAGNGMGSDLITAQGTVWGLVNAITEQVDHHRATRTADSRINRAWFGDGALLKQKAWDTALALAA